MQEHPRENSRHRVPSHASKEVGVYKGEPFKGELPSGMNDPRKRGLLISKTDHFYFKTKETNAGHVLFKD